MKILLEIVLLQLLQVVSGQNCTGTYATIPNIERRASSYVRANNEANVSDALLESKWYNTSHYNMPTSHSNIHVGMCGTYFPIWMDGAIPSSNDGRVTRKACIFTISIESIEYNCNSEKTIEVVNCSKFMLYKLVPTAINSSGYCFDYFQPLVDDHTESNTSWVNVTNVTHPATLSTTYASSGYGNTTSATPDVLVPTCDENKDRKGTLWDITYINVSVTKPCPSGSIGNVTRFCSSNAKWEEPNYGCVNKRMILLKNEAEMLLNGTTVINMSTFLSKLNQVTDPLQVELQEAEIEIVVSLLDIAVDIPITGDILGSSQVYENFFTTASNVVDVNTSPSWQVLILNKNRGVETVLKSVERFVQRISNSIRKNEWRSNLTFKAKNIDVEIGYKLPFEFPRNNHSSPKEKKPFHTGLILPTLWDNNYTYAAVFYKNVSVMLQKKVIQNGNAIDMRGRLDIGPEVLSLQLIPNPVNLPTPFQLLFKSFDTKYTNPLCSYWSFNATADGGGAWSHDGCQVVSRNSSGVCCVCNHLTNFGILMAPSEITDLKHNVTLSIISDLGCAVSLICLMLTLLGHLIIWRHVKSRRTCILMNICVALLLSNATFLAGVNRTENKVVCIVIAALMHYFFLTVFFLMLVEGIWIGVSVQCVFPPRPYIDWLLPLGWLIPMVIVGASLGITRLDGYGNEHFCWLSVRDGLIWAFVGPAALVSVINGIIIVTVLRKMLNTSALRTKTKQERARASLRGLGVLLPLTGVTWALGIFSLNEDLVVFQYLFTIFNSTQGLFVFLFNIVLNKEVRKAITAKCSRNKGMQTYGHNYNTATTDGSQEMSTVGAWKKSTENLNK